MSELSNEIREEGYKDALDINRGMFDVAAMEIERLEEKLKIVGSLFSKLRDHHVGNFNNGHTPFIGELSVHEGWFRLTEELEGKNAINSYEKLQATNKQLLIALERCVNEMQGGDYCETGDSALEQAEEVITNAKQAMGGSDE